MMDYEIFKEEVSEKFRDFLPEEYQEWDIRIRPVQKVNVTLDGISLFDKNSKLSVSPMIYINDMYKRYQDINDLQAVLQTMADMMVQAMKQVPEPAMDFKTAEEKVFFQLVNTEQNRDMLAGLPHREFQDLSIIYRWLIDNSGEGIQSIVVDDQIKEKIGMSEEQLFQAAAQNTRNLLPPVVKSVDEVIYEIFTGDGMPEELAKLMLDKLSTELKTYIITNEKAIGGAASMLYETELHKLAERLDDDLYILPSSIHEAIVVPASAGIDPGELAQMVFEINMTQVSLSERLSNQVYLYDKDLRKLSLATDTPNKRLDGAASETPMVYEAK